MENEFFSLIHQFVLDFPHQILNYIFQNFNLNNFSSTLDGIFRRIDRRVRSLRAKSPISYDRSLKKKRKGKTSSPLCAIPSHIICFRWTGGVFVAFIISPICTLCHIPLLYCVCNIIFKSITPLSVLWHMYYRTKLNPMSNRKNQLWVQHTICWTQKNAGLICVYLFLNVYVRRASTLHWKWKKKSNMVWHGRTHTIETITSFQAMVYLFLAYWIMC